MIYSIMFTGDIVHAWKGEAAYKTMVLQTETLHRRRNALYIGRLYIAIVVQ